MPLMPWKQCPVGGCPELTRGGGRCEKHSKELKKDQSDRRGTSAQRGYDRKWRKKRSAYLSRNPLCVDCLVRGITKVADLVHHIDGNSKNNKWDNLKALCTTCHELYHKGRGVGFLQP